MVQPKEPNNVRVSRLRHVRSFDNKYQHSSIKKREPRTIIHVNIGTLRNIHSINTKSELDKQSSNARNNHQYEENQTKVSIIQKPKITEEGSIHSAGSNIAPPSHHSLCQHNGNVTRNQSSQVNSSMKTPYQNVLIDHNEDGKDMTNDVHQKPKNNKRTICSRRCVLTSVFITFLIILILTAVLLGVLIKPNSTTTLPTDTPLLRWNSSGITVAGIVNNSGNANNQLDTPYDVILDDGYNLYIADFGNHRIQKYFFGSSVGQTVAGNGTPGSSPYLLWYPRRVIVDSNGSLYIADSPNNRIQYWTNGATSGKTVAGSATGSYGNGINQLNYPYGIALNPTSGELYISDGNNQRIMSYAPGAKNGTLVFGGNGYGNNNTQLNYPFGLHFDSFSNNFISANTNANNVVQYVSGASSWTLVAGDINGGAGATSTRFIGPTEVTFDPMGNMYVADTYNHRIQFFYAGQTNGTTIAGISGTSGSNAITLYEPRSVRLDNQLNLYVADTNNHRVQKFLRY